MVANPLSPILQEALDRLSEAQAGDHDLEDLLNALNRLRDAHAKERLDANSGLPPSVH